MPKKPNRRLWVVEWTPYRDEAWTMHPAYLPAWERKTARIHVQALRRENRVHPGIKFRVTPYTPKDTA